MSGIRCQLCDGFIINGRCKICGMPYRNDEVLYHLNESRHTHYKHATPKAKEMMHQNMIPLGDTKSGKAKTSDRVMSKEQIRAQQEKIRKEAMAKINATKVPNKNTTVKQSTKKKGLGGVWWILIVLYILFGVISKNL